MKFSVLANSFIKDFLLFSRVGLLIKPFSNFFLFLSRFAALSSWIHTHKKGIYTDFYSPKRNYVARFKLYEHVSIADELKNEPIDYLEFGVASGLSFNWWLQHNAHPDSRFYGFDTFEGLPEDWHFFKKGDMRAELPEVDDNRAKFVKGLFQDTLLNFLKSHPRGVGKMVIHMDADLYSSTLFSLTTLAPYLKPGDIIFFDEFNVPNHEYAAWNDFVRSYYIPNEVIGSVNNFYQCAFRILPKS
jgi:O-methyltransferase